MSRRMVCVALLLLLAWGLSSLLLTACEPSYRDAGREIGGLVNDAESTVQAEAEEAVSEFQAGLQESGACSGAALALVGGGMVAAVVSRRRA
ncbi:MAG: hypothetical protein PVH11_09625 [Anaerolineae bacterium]